MDRNGLQEKEVSPHIDLTAEETSTSVNENNNNQHDLQGTVQKNVCENEVDKADADTLKEIEKLAKAHNITSEVLNFVPSAIFEFEIPWEKLKKIYNFETNTFLKGKWADVISEHFTDAQKVCTFNADRSPQYNEPAGQYNFCILKGHCPCDLQFTIDIPNQPVRGENLVCHVKTQGKFQLLQTRSTGRKLKGQKREELAKTLLHEKAGKIYLKNIKCNTLLRFLHNNNIQMSIKVLQKLRHEAKHALAASPDVFEDIVLFCAESEQMERGEIVRGFVQEKCFREDEINVKMYNESSLRLLLTCHSETDLIMNFDATGSVVLDKYGKRMLYYLAHIRTNEGYSFPLASMISQSGKAVDIARLFQIVKRDIKKLKPSFNKPLVSVAVCDFSFATMTALCNGINTQTMKDYIRDSYAILLSKEVLERDRSVIFVCNSHILKSYCRLLAKHIKCKKIYHMDKSVDIRQLAVHSFAKIVSSRDLLEFARSSFAFCETFCSKTLSEEKLNNNLAFLTNHDVSEEFDDSKLEEFDFEAIFPSHEHFELRERSRFYHLFKSIREKATESNVSSPTSVNETFNPVVVDLIEKYYIQYAPFYCSMILYSTERSGEERYSNSAVESEFKFLKNIFMDHDRYALNIFIRHVYEYHVGRTLEVIAAAARKGNKSARKSTSCPNLQEEDSVEIWRRRKTKKKTPKYMPVKVRHDPKNLKTKSIDFAMEARKFVDSNLIDIEKVEEADIAKTLSKSLPCLSAKKSSKKTSLPDDMNEIYNDVIKKALSIAKADQDSCQYKSPNDGELQTCLKKHRYDMQKRAEEHSLEKRSEMYHGSLIIYERTKKVDGKQLKTKFI